MFSLIIYPSPQGNGLLNLARKPLHIVICEILKRKEDYMRNPLATIFYKTPYAVY